MEHYITEIKIDELRHLSNITIELKKDRRTNLLLTGKNGSGKTTVLQAVKKYLTAITEKKNDRYEFEPLEESIEIDNTVHLLHDAYYGTTEQKKMEAVNIRRELRRNLSAFKEYVREYEEADDYDKEDYKCAIKREVGGGEPFTAFKRWLLWEHQERYQELIEYCGLPDSPQRKETGKES